jgi:hypothetical protein
VVVVEEEALDLVASKIKDVLDLMRIEVDALECVLIETLSAHMFIEKQPNESVGPLEYKDVDDILERGLPRDWHSLKLSALLCQELASTSISLDSKGMHSVWHT